MDGAGWYGIGGPPPRPGGRPGLNVIQTDLLVGEYPNPADASWLQSEHGVTAVLSLQDDADLASKGLVLARLEDAYRTHGMQFHRIPVPDGDDRHLIARVGDIVALLARLLGAGERVYLHCNAGFNRAPTAAIAYLHVHAGLSLAAARDLVKRCRPCVPYMRALEAHFSGRAEP
jgi:protein-tyrosine phosphatase